MLTEQIALAEIVPLPRPNPVCFPAITEADLLSGYGAAADVCVGCLP